MTKVQMKTLRFYNNKKSKGNLTKRWERIVVKKIKWLDVEVKRALRILNMQVCELNQVH